VSCREALLQSVSRRQFSASVLSANRQKWIETLRDQLAEVISLIVAALIVKNRFKNRWDEGRGAFESNPALVEKLQRLVLAQSKIRLLMNPTEPDHQRLYQAIDVALRRLKSEAAHESETEADVEAITALAQAILKREWHRVKAGT
jgi:hypothetical protein